RLRAWGLFDGYMNPVARSKVCPQINPPSEPSFHAFSFTIEAEHASPTFVIAGSGEAAEGSGGSYAQRAVRAGESSPDADPRKGAVYPGRGGTPLKSSWLRLGGHDGGADLYCL